MEKESLKKKKLSILLEYSLKGFKAGINIVEKPISGFISLVISYLEGKKDVDDVKIETETGKKIKNLEERLEEVEEVKNNYDGIKKQLEQTKEELDEKPDEDLKKKYQWLIEEKRFMEEKNRLEKKQLQQELRNIRQILDSNQGITIDEYLELLSQQSQISKKYRFTKPRPVTEDEQKQSDILELGQLYEIDLRASIQPKRLGGEDFVRQIFKLLRTTRSNYAIKKGYAQPEYFMNFFEEMFYCFKKRGEGGIQYFWVPYEHMPSNTPILSMGLNEEQKERRFMIYDDSQPIFFEDSSSIHDGVLLMDSPWEHGYEDKEAETTINKIIIARKIKLQLAEKINRPKSPEEPLFFQNHKKIVPLAFSETEVELIKSMQVERQYALGMSISEEVDNFFSVIYGDYSFFYLQWWEANETEDAYFSGDGKILCVPQGSPQYDFNNIDDKLFIFRREEEKINELAELKFPYYVFGLSNNGHYVFSKGKKGIWAYRIYNPSTKKYEIGPPISLGINFDREIQQNIQRIKVMPDNRTLRIIISEGSRSFEKQEYEIRLQEIS